MDIESRLKNKRILQVDDSLLTSKIVSEFLNQNGYETEMVATGEEAVQKAYSSSQIDLILMDIELAGKMNGIDAARKITQYLDIPIVFFTANASIDIINKIKEVKAYGFVLKGMDKAALLSTVEMAFKLHTANTNALMCDQIFENLADEIYIFDSQSFKFIALNNAAIKNVGYTKEELDSMTFLDNKPKLEIEVFNKIISQLNSGKQQHVVFDTIHQRKNGSLYPVEINLQFFNYGKRKLFLALVIDLTERKRAYDKIEDSRKQYLELAENAPIGIVKCDTRGKIIYANQKTLEILGSPDIRETKEINLLKFPALVKFGLSKKLEECLQNNELGVYEMDYESKWGKKVCLRLHIRPLTDRNRVTGAQIIIDDITEKKYLEEELRSLSLTDPLTNVYNRRFFIQKLEEEIERIQRKSSSTFSLVMLDLDRFKRINDRFGHNAGDMVLKNLTKTIKSRIRKIDCLARWGGEEFVILLQGISLDQAVILVEELRENISNMETSGVDRVTASFGVTEYCVGDTVDLMIQKADNFMYEAKTAGRNCVCSIKNTEKKHHTE